MSGRRRLLAVVVAALVLSPATAQASMRVGHRIAHITGQARNVDVHLWYPADAADWATRPQTSYTSVYNGVALPAPWHALSWRFDAELAHEGAAVAAGGPAFPVIVFSHGSVNDPINSAHLLERIAADGFVIAAPTHANDTQEDVRFEYIVGRLGAAVQDTFKYCLDGHERNATVPPIACARPNNSGQDRMVERHADLVNTLNALPGWLGSRADMTRVGVLGHSRGTLTGLTAAAGAPAPTAALPWTAAREPRVKAVMGMASGGAQAFTLTPKLSEIDIPTLIVAGRLDNNSPLTINTDLYNQIGCPLADAPPARPPGCQNPKASKEFVILDQAHHRTFISTFCDQTRAVGTIARANTTPSGLLTDNPAIFEAGALSSLTGANGTQFLTQLASGRAMDYCSPDTFAGWEDLVRSATALTAAGGFCITPATIAPGAPCNQTGAVPTTGLDEEEVKRDMTALAIRFFTDKLGRDRDGDGVADTADNCLTAANPDQRDTDGDGAGNACDLTPYGTTPPTLTVPADVTANATGPDGVTVTFTATATDDLDPDPTVTCVPASGSRFAIGATTVTCTATDHGGNSTPPASFVVTVRGAHDQLAVLRAAVDGIGPGYSLINKVSHVQAALAADDLPAACSILGAFAQEVTAQAGKKIPAAAAASLTADAERIKAVLAC